MPDYETLLYEETDGVAWVTLNRPDVHNAFNFQMQHELKDVWRGLRTNDDVRCVVLTGAGDKAFCTGIDRDETMGDWSDARRRRRQERVRRRLGSTTPWHFDDPGENIGPKTNDLWKPVIAAVNGMACGGAFYMLGEVDFIIAAEHATFFDPHVTYGMTACFESIHMLQKMPFHEIMRVALLGASERMTARRGYEIGLVSEVVADNAALHDAAAWAAEVIAAASPTRDPGNGALVVGRTRAVTHAGTRHGQGADQGGQRPGVAVRGAAVVQVRRASQATAAVEPVRYGTTAGRWVLAAAVLGSGIAFLDSTVVNVALPAIGEDLDTGVSQLQWTLDAYLVSLSSLLLLGGSLGDALGRRRVFVGGLLAFVGASLFCGVAPNATALIAARALQGAAAAFLVPGSLSIISATFHPDDRGRAVGAWSGLAGVTSAIGPFVGGWLIDAVSWRLIFLINLPLAAIAIWIALRHVPETRDDEAGSPDFAGAALITAGVAAVTYGLIEQEVVVGILGVVAVVAFVVVEQRARAPMLPIALFRSLQFTGANLTTFAVYAGLGGALFLLVVHLQVTLSYSALEAGVSLLPLTIFMLLLSARAGQVAQKIGPRLPMTVGPIVAGAGLWLCTRVDVGTSYASAVFPGVALFGLGMTITVAPLTAAVLAAADERHIGAASGVNNAVARLAGLLAVAVLPALAGIDGGDVAGGFDTAMRIAAITCASGGVIAWFTISASTPVQATAQPALDHPCHDSCRRQQAA